MSGGRVRGYGAESKRDNGERGGKERAPGHGAERRKITENAAGKEESRDTEQSEER
ncbi:MAG: hypothetical protein HFH85_10910 [Lachnospiraceae bacterium]|nr:hypothetical protein [Lachnospiraceae bacterium]